MNPLIVALDLDPRKALGAVKELSPHVEIFKIGNRLFTARGPECVQWAVSRRKKVFLDLKFHDIPNTVAESCRNAARLGVWGLTLHISGGTEMMRRAVESVRKEPRRIGQERPLLFGVTVLTSMDRAALKQVGVNFDPDKQVERLALLAMQSGLDGVVCSGREIETVRKKCGKKFLIAVPGLRPSHDSGRDDQKRTVTVGQARAFGADFFIVGRPVLESRNRVKSVQNILKEVAVSDRI